VDDCANSLLVLKTQDAARGIIQQGDLVAGVGDDHTAGDGGEDVVEQGFDLADLGQGGVDLLEQAGVLNRDRCLVGEGAEHGQFSIAEQPGPDAIVGVDHAADAILTLERDAEDAAQGEGNNAFLGSEARIVLSVGSDNRLAGLGDALDHAAADGERLLSDGLPVEVTGDAVLQLAGLLGAEHQVAPLGTREPQDDVHRLVQDFIQVKGAVDQGRCLRQGAELAEGFLLLFQAVDQILYGDLGVFEQGEHAGRQAHAPLAQDFALGE